MGSGLSLLFTLNSTHSRIFDTSGFSARNFLCRRRFGRSQIGRAFCGRKPRLANIEIRGRHAWYIDAFDRLFILRRRNRFSSYPNPRRGIRRHGLRPGTVPPPATIRAGHGILNGRSTAARPRLHDDAGNRTVPLPCNDKIRRPLLRQTTAHPLPTRHSFALQTA